MRQYAHARGLRLAALAQKCFAGIQNRRELLHQRDVDPLAAQTVQPIGELDQHLLRLSARGDVEIEPDHAIRTAARMAHRRCACQHPAPATVLVAQPMLMLEARRVAVDVRLQLGESVVAIFRMDAAVPFVDTLADLAFVIAEHALPAGEKYALPEPTLHSHMPSLAPLTAIM